MNRTPLCAVFYYIHPSALPLSADRQKTLTRQMLGHAFSAFFKIPLQEELIKREPCKKPRYDGAPGCYFNITHCAAAAAVAVARVPAGIDTEAPRPVQYRTAQKCCSPEELQYVSPSAGHLPNRTRELTKEETGRFIALWTLKESYVKMTGDGMRIPFKTVAFDLSAFQKTGPDILQWGRPGQYQSCLFTPGSITIALTLKHPGPLCASEVLWHPYVLCPESSN